MANPNTWTSTSNPLGNPYVNHISILLPNGKVLIASGSGSAGVSKVAALYDPTTDTWTATGSLNKARPFDPTGTLLTTGKVLVAGGADATAELYDPSTGSWTLSSNPMTIPRSDHTATLLPNGKVLIAGGNGAAGTSAELYDPTTDTWTATGSLNTARANHTATLLRTGPRAGQVLVAGGSRSVSGTTTTTVSVERYDPATGTWTEAGSLNTARASHTATLLRTGQVLVAGGAGSAGTSAELFDPMTGAWTATGSLATAHVHHPATLLSDGRVLIAGGGEPGSETAVAELYNPWMGTWTAAASLQMPRTNHAGTLLPDNRYLVSGGTPQTSLGSAEYYTAPPPAIGYLRSCMDKRFVATTRRKFEELTGFKETEYYHEAFAGGALGTLADLAALQGQVTPPPNPPAANGADYVYTKVNGTDATLVVMGWQVHLDHCGGLPGLTDGQILDKIRRLILSGTLQAKYPKVAKHIFLVQPPAPKPVPLPTDTVLTFDSTGVQYNTWCHVLYRDLDGQLVLWDSGQFGPSQVTITVPGGATNVFIEGGAIGGSPIFNTGSSPIVTNAYAGGGSLPSGTVTITLTGTATAPSFSANPSLP